MSFPARLKALLEERKISMRELGRRRQHGTRHQARRLRHRGHVTEPLHCRRPLRRSVFKRRLHQARTDPTRRQGRADLRQPEVQADPTGYL